MAGRRGAEQPTNGLLKPTDIEAEPAATPSEQFLTKATFSSAEALILRGQERGYVTYGEIDAVLPMDQTSSEQIEDAMTVLSELGINVIEDDDTVETSVSSADGDATEVRGNIGEDIGRSDDPVRMYLREMGSLGLLSREGEVAIAKRIEIGRRTMVGGICESPLTVRAIMLWRDSLNQGKLLLRDIIDLDAMYSSANLLLADADAAIPPRVVAAEAGEEDKEAEVENGQEGGVADDTDRDGDQCFVSLAMMEAQLGPSLTAIFERIADIHNELYKLQEQRLAALVTDASLPRATAARHDKLKDEVAGLLRRIPFNGIR